LLVLWHQEASLILEYNIAFSTLAWLDPRGDNDYLWLYFSFKSAPVFMRFVVRDS
jgi:hypothetical protein